MAARGIPKNWLQFTKFNKVWRLLQSQNGMHYVKHLGLLLLQLEQMCDTILKMKIMH